MSQQHSSRAIPGNESSAIPIRWHRIRRIRWFPTSQTNAKKPAAFVLNRAYACRLTQVAGRRMWLASFTGAPVASSDTDTTRDRANADEFVGRRPERISKRGNMAWPSHRDLKVSFKAFDILVKYHGRRVLKGGTAKLPYLLFVVSFLLFAIALLPGLRSRLRDSILMSDQPVRIDLQGTVTSETVDSKGLRMTHPLGGVIVEVGALNTRTSTDGKYLLSTDAFRGEDLPVIFDHQDQTVIGRVRIPNNGKSVIYDFEFPQ